MGHSRQAAQGEAGTIRDRRAGRAGAALALLLAATTLSACANIVGGSGTSLSGVTRTYQRGYVLSEGALDQVPVGSSQEQVLLVLGTPSTVATVNGQVFYYISQTAQKVAFLKPEITEQKVLAIYFDKNNRVSRVAQYGLKDGKVFDFVSQTTPTSGEDLSLVQQLIGLVSF
ncbi:outer membrane protein assembly factor BamE [Xanthobacter sediminis]|uniref:outer membrane protein assembly factor BamE n=1 Tax=Xanthobacter sediminis TaxID=3119926 RepID=UPI00372C7CEA